MIAHDARSPVAEPVRSARHRLDGDGWTGLVLGAALVAMALVAGLIYTFSVAVMPNLAGADGRTFVATMQRFNENPVFQLSFTGALVLTALAAVLQRRHGSGVAVRWTVAALVLYGIVVAVTFGINIPLNDELDRAGDPGLRAQPDGRHLDRSAGREDLRRAMPMVHAHDELASGNPRISVPAIDLRVDAERHVRSAVIDEQGHKLDWARGHPLRAKPERNR